MVRTTREQRVALKQVFGRRPIYHEGSSATALVVRAGWVYKEISAHSWMWTHPDRKAMYSEADHIVSDFKLSQPISYREFRKLAGATIGCDGAIVVPWCNMWLAIEQDGYCHS